MTSGESPNEVRQHDVTGNAPKIVKFSVSKGLLMAALSGLAYASTSAFVKYIRNIHPGQLVMYRYIALMFFAFPEAVKCKENLIGPKGTRSWIIISNISSTIAVFLSFIAFRYLPLGESTVIISTLPIFVTFAARIFLKEFFGYFQFFNAFMAVLGIIFTSKIPQKLSEDSVVYTMESIYGLLSAGGSLIFRTISLIVIRKIKSVHHSIMIFSYGWIPVLEAAALTAIVGDFKLHHCGVQGIYIIFIGLLGYISFSLTIMALQYEMAGPVVTVRASSDIILAFIYQIFLFQDIPDIYSLIGAVLIGASLVLIGLGKWISSLNEESPWKKKLRWMLK